MMGRSGAQHAERPAGPTAGLDLGRASGRLFFGTVLLSAASISKLALQLVLIPILAHLLGPSIFGLMSIAMSFVLLANMLSDGGMGAALVREEHADRDLESTVYWLSVLIGIVLAALVCLVSWPLSILYAQPGLALVLCALSPILILSANISVANAHIVRSQRFDLFAAGDFGCSVVSAAAGITMAYHGFGIWSLIVQQLLLWTTKAAWVSSVSRFRPKFVLKLKLARPLFRFSANNLAASVADFAGKSAPVLIVGGLLGVNAAGHYSMAYQLTRIADMVVSNPVNLATFSAVAIAANRHAAASFVLTALRILVLVLMPLFCGLALTANLLSPVLLGQKWLGTAPALAALAPGAFFMCLFGFVTAALLGKGRSGRVFKLTLLTGAATAIGTCVGVRYGVTGAALGFSLGATVMAPFYLSSLARPMHLPISRLLSATTTGLAATGAMTCAVLLLRSQIAALSPIQQLAATIAVGAIAFAATTALMGGRQIRNDIEKLRRRIPEEPNSVPEAWQFLPPDSKSQNPMSG
jgi:O-antigen/teichoic acid export membrane protein